MMTALSNIMLVNPLILFALAILPLLWFLLRITPPSAQTVSFYAMRFLEGLVPENVTPSKTPWWILLLRLIIAALVILALAHPIYNPSRSLTGSGTLRLVINNDWSAAQNWDDIIQSAEQYLAQAERDERSVELITTAKRLESDRNNAFQVMSASQALTIIKALEPKPWGNDYTALINTLQSRPSQDGAQTFFLSNGLNEEGLIDFVRALRQSGPLHFMKVENSDIPVYLAHPEDESTVLQIRLATPTMVPAGVPYSAQARTQEGRLLGSQTLQSTGNTANYIFDFEIPELLRNEVSQFSIAGRNSAATTYILDDRFRKRSVGIAAEDIQSDTPAALTQSPTYIRKALEPYANLHFGSIQDLLKNDLSMMILPDIGAIPIDTLNALENWVNKGGLLLRFAGPNMTQNLNSHYLVPVPLRAAGRSLDGALSWETPLSLQPFPQSSPFYSMDIPADLTVKQQVLAEPVQNIEELTWAALKDGTPIITADKKGDGLVVLIHTTASPEWSNFSLSGLFVQILRRLSDLSGRNISDSISGQAVLDPLYVMDGFGALKQPDSSIKPLNISEGQTPEIGPEHPPGVYGRGGIQKVINLGDNLGSIRAVGSLPANISVSGYHQNYELDMRPHLLYAALALLLLDWFIMIFLSLGLRALDIKRAVRLSSIALLYLTLFPSNAIAQDLGQSLGSISVQSDKLKYADDLYLAYMTTGDSTIDATTQSGLEVLAAVLTARTSAEPAGVVGLTPDSDILAFFPLIYWPLSANAGRLTNAQVQNIQHYLDHGGTILFDTRDQSFSGNALGGSSKADSLKNLVSNLNIPPLRPIPDDHVLGRSFYLLTDYPGKYSGGTIWVESVAGDSGRDGVSSILIGSHDWAASWAANSKGGNRNLYGANKQQEHSLRFGVNLMIYALTGNYKSDQVHIPHILERLGQ